MRGQHNEYQMLMNRDHDHLNIRIVALIVVRVVDVDDDDDDDVCSIHNPSLSVEAWISNRF
jgi:hypothetical protein